MSYQSKYTGNEIDSKLDEINIIDNTLNDINTNISSIESNLNNKVSKSGDAIEELVINNSATIYGDLGVYKILNVGSHIKIWVDNEGGNIDIKSGGEHTNTWQIDSHDGDLRFYTWRESDGEYKDIKFNQETGLIYGTNLLNAYPIGAIYMSVDSTSPASLFGGAWEPLKDRFLIGAGGNYTVGSTGGEATHTLTVAEMPSHTHSETVNYYNYTASYMGLYGQVFKHSSTPIGTDTHTIGATGGGAAHNIMPPYLSVYMWKRIS